MNLFIAIGNRFKAADPHHSAIFKGMATVALFVLLGKLISAAKEVVVAYRYGLGAEVDAYQFIYNLISWPIGVWASVLTAVLVPLAVRVRQTEAEKLPRFRSELLGFALLLSLVLAVLGWCGIKLMLVQGWGGLPATTTRLAAEALPGMILLLPLGILITLQSAWMLSAGRHVNTLLDSVPTLFIGGAVLLFAHGGMGPLVWGTLVGSAMHFLCLIIPMVRRHEFEAPSFAYRSEQWTWFWQGFGIMLGGQALLSLTVIVDQFFAVDLGTGSIATLGYANRILSLIMSLAATAVSRATLPVFAQARLNSATKMHDVVMYWACLMFLGGLVTVVIGYWLAPWAVKLLFERGAFTSADTMTVAEVLRYGLPQLPFYFSSMVLVSYALSERRFSLIFWSGVIGFIGKVAGNIFLVPALGINGISLASLCVYGANALFFWIALRKRLQ
ncbi:peptidoglycan biosynthesis protein MviN/MurJ (putative lipid II flippase) [Paucimonas lemoignei]|uniref:Peptidoglycan biosynthesis protein MviN/MurJ (Putative lipid II flippase) n=1 Tax=Paucimonas lemoignei TaxID=29443 RepID=A0A4R3HV53_PAULE|nr:lipid II flippase MurJ [Paucimonas lemoignei]TCS34320.1 peptidoglycan biosynthesis protein MviN/MurJ (putative lipid II flippase) [Paucimonas lemoignei]